MGQALPLPRMSYAEFLAFEAQSETKHEYLRGEVWDMAGSTPEHARLTAAVSAALVTGLRGRPCAVYSSDARIRISVTDRSTYPDVSVVCGRPVSPPEDPLAISNPTLIVEVLSESSEDTDRGEKFAHYRQLGSLREYVLVGQKERRIQGFRRQEDGRWTLTEATAGQTIHLASLGIDLAVDDIYFDPTATL